MLRKKKVVKRVSNKEKIAEAADLWRQIKAIVLRRPITGRQGAILMGRLEELFRELQ